MSDATICQTTVNHKGRWFFVSTIERVGPAGAQGPNWETELMLVTTCLEFSDRYEGQVLHEGDLESCVNLSQLINALSYSGDEAVLSSSLKIVEQLSPPVSVGQYWKLTKSPNPGTAGKE